MDVLHIGGWLLVLLLLYMALQSFIGFREYQGMVRQERSEGKDTRGLGGRTPSEIVMRGGVSYFVVMGIELALAAVAAVALTR